MTEMEGQASASADPLVAQLKQARQVVLENAANYPAIIPSILPIIGPGADLELRRWGAEFLAETFASPILPAEQKQQLSSPVLDKIKEYLDTPAEDVAVVKGAVQAAASIYPLVFRHIIYNPHDSSIWTKMAAIKSNIMRRMDSAPPGARICCIKFVQRVVLTQTPGLIADPRRPEHNEISLALVPRDHPLIPPPNLEAEASGLLDRLLSILQEESSDALLVTATLNSLGGLIRSRASIANKIISTVLNFNPLKLANSPMTPKNKVMVKSMERTTRALLLNVIKKNPNHPLAGRIQQHIDRLHHTRLEIFDEISRKRPAPAEPTDGLDHAKRQRLGADVAGIIPPPALGAGPVSYAQLYTLTQDEGSKNFDVQAIPIDLLVRILVPIIGSIDKAHLDNAINAVRSRYLSLSKTQNSVSTSTPLDQRLTATDEDDDYEPEFQPTDHSDAFENKMDGLSSGAAPHELMPEAALGTFHLPSPPALTGRDTAEYGRCTITRVFEVMAALDDPGRAKGPKHGFNRLAASNYDRDAWVTIITRLATRASSGLEDGAVKLEHEAALAKNAFISNSIRDSLYLYVLEDFRRRIDVAISWLSEEWYNDRLQPRRESDDDDDNDDDDNDEPSSHYEKWALKVLDGILPYLDAKDKVLIRFLSEIPELVDGMLDRIKGLARDPERISLAVNSIHYLILMRPPVREVCIDAIEDLWRNYDGAKGLTTKLISKWRPQLL